jgi:hypothetical protein
MWMKRILIVLILIIINFCLGQVVIKPFSFYGYGESSNTLSDGLIAWYKMETTSFEDDIGTNDMTNSGVSITTGFENNCGDFELSETDYLYNDDYSDSLYFNDTFTIAFWFKYESYGNRGGFISQFDINSITDNIVIWEKGADSDKINFRLYDTGGTGHDLSGIQITDADWHCVIAQWDPDNDKMYLQIDSNLDSLTSQTWTAQTPSTDFRIGAYWNGSAYKTHDGLIDEVMVWNRIVDRDSIYNSGSGAFPGGAGIEASSVSISSPDAYTVFQRDESNRSDIYVSGTTDGYDLEISFGGDSWQNVGYYSTGSFGQWLTGCTGQETIYVRARSDPSDVIDSVQYIGVGDVFAIWGQSNASGRGTNNQSYSHATLKATMYGNDYTWKELSDPTDDNTDQTDSVSDDGGDSAGSIWPILADSIMANEGIPVAFIPCAMEATSAEEWLPGADFENRSTLFGSANYRCHQMPGGIKMVFWWQGEKDANSSTATSEANYETRLDSIVSVLWEEQMVGLMPFILQDCNNTIYTYEDTINAAIEDVIANNNHVFDGADLNDISTDDNAHLQTDAKLDSAADRTWRKLKALFY